VKYESHNVGLDCIIMVLTGLICFASCSMFGHLRRLQALDQFAYAIVETPVGKKCVQIGTHGDGLSAETEEMSLSPGAPQAWTPGACPADYGELLCSVSRSAEARSGRKVMVERPVACASSSPGLRCARSVSGTVGRWWHTLVERCYAQKMTCHSRLRYEAHVVGPSENIKMTLSMVCSCT
jgi:hypothetical protein